MLDIFPLSEVALTPVTIAWIALPFITAFSIYLLPQYDRILALALTLISGLYTLVVQFSPDSTQLVLLDNFGVTVQVDELTAYFVLTNALVTAAVILYCWTQNKGSFFYTLVIALHGSVNSAFICSDFISLYVALEVISVSAFLLIVHPRSERAIWVGLRYLFISNTVMLFYLIGTILVYQANHSFAFEGLAQAPSEATALIALGLLTKGGIFVSGLWLPQTHAESDTPVSALLSGIVVKTGIFPLVRCAQLVPSFEPLVVLFGLATAFLGVSYAIVEKDTKRTLAASTISQLGFVLVTPMAAGGYALCHGLAKSALFLLAGNLPSRQFEVLRQTPLPLKTWLPLALASLSIAGCPLLAGFGAKAATLKMLDGWSGWLLNLAAVGTAIAFGKFLLLPVDCNSSSEAISQSATTSKKSSLRWAMGLLLSSLILANVFFLEFYQLGTVAKALLVLGLGSSLSVLAAKQVNFQFPATPERFEHLIGGMSLMLTLLFWLVVV